MNQPKDTEVTTEKQPPNDYFGRIPDRLLPVIRDLTHLEAHVFLVLCILANRTETRGPLGEVCMTKTALAQECGIKRWPLYRAIAGLTSQGLVTSGDNGCHIVCHYLTHEMTPPVTPCDTVSPQPQQPIEVTATVDVSEDVEDVEDAAAAKKKPRKAPRKRVEPWLYWDAELSQLRCHKDDPRYSAFMATWSERLGNEERVVDEYYKAEAWLIRYPDKRAKTKSFERFLRNWLGKEE